MVDDDVVVDEDEVVEDDVVEVDVEVGENSVNVIYNIYRRLSNGG